MNRRDTCGVAVDAAMVVVVVVLSFDDDEDEEERARGGVEDEAGMMLKERIESRTKAQVKK